jgi:hypothetical protein
LIQIMDAQGRVIKTLHDRDTPAGEYNIRFESNGFPAGLYYMRFQNGVLQQVKPIIKVR